MIKFTENGPQIWVFTFKGKWISTIQVRVFPRGEVDLIDITEGMSGGVMSFPTKDAFKAFVSALDLIWTEMDKLSHPPLEDVEKQTDSKTSV